MRSGDSLAKTVQCAGLLSSQIASRSGPVLQSSR